MGGIAPGELAAIRGRLEAFADDLFESLPPKDQRARGQCYLRGLMLEGRRKSIEPMAARLGGEVHYQALHHFVAVSPWDWRPLRRRLAEQLVAQLQPTAWAVDDTGFPKDGDHSVGVQRQYCGTLGKTAKSNIAGSNRVAIFAALVEAVARPGLRMMLDLYHAQIGEGNLIQLLKRADSLIGEVQVADVPGRCEPGTGEINFAAIAAALKEMGYRGTVGLEAYASGDDKVALERFSAVFGAGTSA